MHMCRNIGCNESFKWRMQLSRHVIKCSKPVIAKSDSIVETGEGYDCARCGRKYKFKENVYRHFKICKQKVNNVNKDYYRCFKCHRPFITKDLLESHVKQCMPVNEQGVYVDTSNEDNVVLVIPLDENFLPLDNNVLSPSNHTNAIVEPQGYVYQPEYMPTLSRPIEVIPTSSRPVNIITTSSHPVPVIPTLSRPVKVIPTPSHPVDQRNYTVDVKTVRRSTCSNCQRNFVRRDHFQRHIKKCGNMKKCRLSGSSLDSPQNFTCPKCDRKYQRKDHYERHTKKCVYLKAFKLPEKTQQNRNSIIAKPNDTLYSKDQSNVFHQLNEKSKHMHNSSNVQIKFEPEIIDLTDSSPSNQPNLIQQSCDLSKNTPSSSSGATNGATKYAHTSSYSNNRGTSNYLWEKSLRGSSRKVTIINNIRKLNTDRSLTLQNVTDKIVKNLNNDRSRTLQNMTEKNVINFNQKSLTLQSMTEKNVINSYNDKSRIIHVPEKNVNNLNNDRSLTLQNMTEKLIENYSNELSNMDCSDLMSIGKKKETTKDSREQHKSMNIVENINSVVKEEHKSMDIVENVDSVPNKLPEPDDILSMLLPNEEDSLSIEKEAEFEKKVCNAVIDFLKRLYVNNHSRFQFHKMMREIFQEQLNDQQFVCWLYKQLL